MSLVISRLDFSNSIILRLLKNMVCEVQLYNTTTNITRAQQRIFQQLGIVVLSNRECFCSSAIHHSRCMTENSF